jgi:hypothetical protein
MQPEKHVSNKRKCFIALYLFRLMEYVLYFAYVEILATHLAVLYLK